MRATLALLFFLSGGVSARAQSPDQVFSRAFKRIVTADPFSSISNDQGVPSLSTPLPDQLNANLNISGSGAKTTVGLMPLGFSPRYWPVISELRLELFANGAAQPEFGFGVALGYNSASHKLSHPKLSADFVQAQIQQCSAGAKPNYAGDVLMLFQLSMQMIEALKKKAPGPAIAAGLPWIEQELKTLASDPDWTVKVKRAAKQLSQSAGGTLNIEGTYPDLAALGNSIGSYWQKVVDSLNANLDAVGDCMEKAFAKKRLDDAYDNAVGVYLKGTFHFFPVGSGPTFKASDGSTTQPFANPVSLAAINLSVFYWRTRYARVLPSIALSWTGASPFSKQLDKKLTAGVDIGFARAIGKADKDGFEPTYGFGVTFALEKCLEAAGCSRGDIPNYSGPKPKEDWLLSSSVYAFLRVATKLQFQLTLPVNSYALVQPIDMTSTSQNIIEFLPTVTASVSSWTVAQPSN